MRTSRGILFLTLLTAAATSLVAQNNLGSVALGSRTSALVTVYITRTATLQRNQIVTGGAEEDLAEQYYAPDFGSEDGGTCIFENTYSAGSTCTVKIVFAPLFDGTRTASVTLLDSDSVGFGTAYVQGKGLGARLASFPPFPSPFQAVSVSSPVEAIAVDDQNGFYFRKDSGLSGDSVIKQQIDIVKGAVQSVVTTGGAGFALDAAANIYVTRGATITKETPVSEYDYTETLAVSGFINAYLVAVDAAGNLYVADSGNAQTTPQLFKESLQSDGSYLQSTIGSGWQQISGIAVDGSGNVFVSDHANSAVYKETPVSGTYQQSTLVSDLTYASAVAVDSQGNLYYAQDYNFLIDEGQGQIYLRKLLADGAYGIPQPMVDPQDVSAGDSPEALAVDKYGQVWLVDAYTQSVYNYSFNGPGFSFSNTTNGVVSIDSPQSALIQNMGSVPLNTSSITYPPDFPAVKVDTGGCVNGTTLADGVDAGCQLAVEFKPVTPLTGITPRKLSEYVTIVSNDESATPTPIAFPVTGTEVAPVTATPVISLQAGEYYAPQTLTISDATPGATIYYTLDDTIPTTASKVYTGPLTFTTDTILIAIAQAPDYTASPSALQNFYILTPTPALSPQSGAYTSPLTVTISAASGSTILYTINGPAPDIYNATTYTGPITVTSTSKIQAVAGLSGDIFSNVASATYTIESAAAAPTFSPAGGTFTTTQSVTLADTTTGAIVYYTIDGTTPTTASTQYAGAIPVTTSETIKAIAAATGYINSAVASATYTLNLPPPAITLTVSPTSLTIVPGQSASATISVTPVNGFNSATTFACSGLPAGASCSFAPRHRHTFRSSGNHHPHRHHHNLRPQSQHTLLRQRPHPRTLPDRSPKAPHRAALPHAALIRHLQCNPDSRLRRFQQARSRHLNRLRHGNLWLTATNRPTLNHYPVKASTGSFCSRFCIFFLPS